MVDLVRSKRFVLMTVGLLALTVSLSSCETLRKKFIRQKKSGEETQSFVPVLVPQEYPAPSQDPTQEYKQHYDLIKAWYRDLWTAIDYKQSNGQVHETIKQITDNIDAMKKLVDAPVQEELSQLAGFLKYYDSSLDRPWSMRNVSLIQSDLRAFDRYLRDHLRIDRIQGHLVSPG